MISNKRSVKRKKIANTIISKNGKHSIKLIRLKKANIVLFSIFMESAMFVYIFAMRAAISNCETNYAIANKAYF